MDCPPKLIVFESNTGWSSPPVSSSTGSFNSWMLDFNATKMSPCFSCNYWTAAIPSSISYIVCICCSMVSFRVLRILSSISKNFLSTSSIACYYLCTCWARRFIKSCSNYSIRVWSSASFCYNLGTCSDFRWSWSTLSKARFAAILSKSLPYNRTSWFCIWCSSDFASV